MSHNYLNKNRTQELVNTIKGYLSNITTVLTNLASGDARDDTKAPINHTQASNTVTSMTGYSKPASTSAIAATDTLNEAIGKLEKGLEDAGGGGDLAAHIAQQVEDSNGVHGIRCNEGKLEIYNAYTQTWYDYTTFGYHIGNVTNLTAVQGNRSVSISWNDPANTANATWAGTKVIMKQGGYPTSVTDGTEICDSTTRDAYSSSTPLVINNLTEDVTYYFKLFPYTVQGIYTDNSANECNATPYYEILMSVIINEATSNPTSRVTYGDAATGMSKDSDDFDTFIGWYPVLLDSSENEVGKLDRNDYTKFEDGTSAPSSEQGYIVAVAFPRRGIKFSKSNGILTISFTTAQNKPNYSYAAFSKTEIGDCEKLYINAYLNKDNPNVTNSTSNITAPIISYLQALYWLKHGATDNAPSDYFGLFNFSALVRVKCDGVSYSASTMPLYITFGGNIKASYTRKTTSSGTEYYYYAKSANLQEYWTEFYNPSDSSVSRTNYYCYRTAYRNSQYSYYNHYMSMNINTMSDDWATSNSSARYVRGLLM